MTCSKATRRYVERLLLGSRHVAVYGTLTATCLAVTGPSPAAAQQGGTAPGIVVTMPPSRSTSTSMPGVVVGTPSGSPGPAAPLPGMFARPVLPSPGPGATPPPEQKKPVATPKKKSRPKSVASNKHPGTSKSTPQGIAALVNDEPITRFEIDRLARFLSLSANIQDRARAQMKAIAENPRTNERLKAILQETIKANPGKSREQIIAAFEARKKQFVVSLQRQAVESARASTIPGLRKAALDELIEQRLKHQEAKRLRINVPKEESDRAYKGIAERNNVPMKQFEANLKAQGGDPALLKDRIRTQLIWREVIRRKLGHMISISNREIEKAVASATSDAGDLVELELQRVVFSMPGKIDQKIMAQRLQEAERLRRKFSGCKSTAALLKETTGAKLETLGYKKPDTLSEPARSLVLNAKDGEMIPANLTAAGVELYAVCNRRAVKGDQSKREKAENELQQREFERLARRYLQDLRKDALIDIR